VKLLVICLHTWQAIAVRKAKLAGVKHAGLSNNGANVLDILETPDEFHDVRFNLDWSVIKAKASSKVFPAIVNRVPELM
jgi:hypothetical protein